jgi:hypothetical protein
MNCEVSLYKVSKYRVWEFALSDFVIKLLQMRSLCHINACFISSFCALRNML